jgi:hypothetical protein
MLASGEDKLIVEELVAGRESSSSSIRISDRGRGLKIPNKYLLIMNKD